MRRALGEQSPWGRRRGSPSPAWSRPILQSVASDPPACPVGAPTELQLGQGYFESLSDVTSEEVRAALGHFRHWLGHRLGARRDDFLRYLGGQHEELHWLIESCRWSEGVVVLLAGEFFDTNVVCGERWGLEAMERLGGGGTWCAAFELHRHGDRICTADPELNCDLLSLAVSYEAAIVARAVTYDGTPGEVLGTWRAARGEITRIADVPVAAYPAS